MSIIALLELFSIWTSLRLWMFGAELEAMHFARPVILLGVGIALYSGFRVSKWLLVGSLTLGVIGYLASAPGLGFEYGTGVLVQTVVVAVVLAGVVSVLVGSASIEAVLRAREWKTVKSALPDATADLHEE